jgi:hypothetical protein
MKQAADRRDRLPIGAAAWRVSVLLIAVAALSLMAAACSSIAPAAAGRAVSQAQAAQPSASPTGSPVQTSASPTSSAVEPSPAPSPVQPSTLAVPFSGLRTGTYPVHLHSRCNGGQAFHITVVQSLRVASGGSGAIGVPSAYFGRGLCLIVYASPVLSAVVATLPI